MCRHKHHISYNESKSCFAFDVVFKNVADVNFLNAVFDNVADVNWFDVVFDNGFLPVDE